MTDITKEELKAYTDSMVKTVTSLEKIAGSLEDISQSQADCKTKIDSLGLVAHDNQKTLVGMETRQRGMVTNLIWVKWLWTILAGLVGLGIFFLEIMHKISGG